MPPWVLDAPGLRPPLPTRLSPGAGLESLLREAVKTRLEGSRPVTDPDAVKRAQNALRLGSKEAPFAVMYLREVGVEPAFRFSAANALRELLRAELEVDDHTGAVDPRVAGAMWELRSGAQRRGGARGGAPAARGDAALRGAARGGLHPGEQLGRGGGVARVGAGPGGDGGRRRPAGARRGVLRLCRRCRRRRDCAGWRTWRSRRRTWSSCRGCRRARSRPGCPGRSSASATTRRCSRCRPSPRRRSPSGWRSSAQTELGVPAGTVPEDSEGDLVRPPSVLGVREGEAAGPVAGGVRRRPAA